MSSPTKKSAHSSAHAKSTKSHATATATPAAPATVQPTDHGIAPTSAPATGPATGSAPQTPISEVAAKAIKQLDDLEASLNLNIVVRPNDKNQIRALNRVSDSALDLASNIVSESPSSFPAFTGITGVTAYVQAMNPVAARALTLATHVQNSVQNQRAPASLQTLALYGVVKNVGRIVESQTMRENVTALKAEIAAKRTKPKQTKAEKAVKDATRSRDQRITKARLLLENSGLTVSQAPAAPTASSAPAAVASPASPPAAPAQPAVTVASPATPAPNGAAPSATPASAAN